MFDRDNLAEMASKARNAASKTAAKIGAAGTAMVASGAALAGGGGGSPGSAIASELAGGKADVMLVVAAAAIIIGVLVLWKYVKRSG